MLSLLIYFPLLPAAVMLMWRNMPLRVVRRTWVSSALLEVVLAGVIWVAYARGGSGDRVGFEVNADWIPGAGVRYHLGVDGLSMPLIMLTVVIFAACAIYALREDRSVRPFAALFLALETVSIGLFAALDLIVFFVFFDLSLVGMYLVIAGWGHGESARRSAFKFFIYTFLGSLALLVGFIGLFVASDPHTFDMVELTTQMPLAGNAWGGGLVLGAIALGFAIKTPTVPFHTWLPSAHTDAPAIGSAVLAGVMLKMGTYGFIRIAMVMLPDAWRRWAWVFVVVGVVSVLYGALVALAQTNFKRMIAYTSVNHMGYILLAIGVAGLISGSDEQARALAVTGAVTQMVSHGLITAALFLISGVLLDRGGTYEMDEYGGLAQPVPRLAGITAVAAFASLGLPGFSGFIAEFQIFAGSLGPAPWATALALLGILITAGLFLAALHRIFLGPTAEKFSAMADTTRTETLAIVPLLALSVLIGLFPRVLLDIVEPASRMAVQLVAR